MGPIRTRIGNVLKSASPAPNIMGASQGDAPSVCPGVSLGMGLLVLQLGKSQANQDTLDTPVLQQMSGKYLGIKRTPRPTLDGIRSES